MRISRFCSLVLIVLFCSALAFADSIQDPKIIVKGAGGDLIKGPCPQCVAVGSSFSFTIPANGSGTLYFTNESGKNWSSLKLIETGVPAADISCHSALFASCTTETLKNGSVEILLSGVQNGAEWRDHGIANGQNFAIQFACVKGSCWPGGIQISGHGGTPEPGTVALMVTGLGAIFSRRKRWKTKFSS